MNYQILTYCKHHFKANKAIVATIKVSLKPASGSYAHFTPAQRFEIGKSAAEHSIAARKDFQSTVSKSIQVLHCPQLPIHINIHGTLKPLLLQYKENKTNCNSHFYADRVATNITACVTIDTKRVQSCELCRPLLLKCDKLIG